jgi:hypothetical protein
MMIIAAAFLAMGLTIGVSIFVYAVHFVSVAGLDLTELSIVVHEAGMDLSEPEDGGEEVHEHDE